MSDPANVTEPEPPPGGTIYNGAKKGDYGRFQMTPDKAYYIKFETPKEVAEAAYEVLRQASRSGKVKKGTNECTKAIERGVAKLVVIAEDVQPPEVVAHLPILCDERKIPYVFVPSKDQIGPAIGIDVSTASAAVVDAGEGAQVLEQVTQELARLKKPA